MAVVELLTQWSVDMQKSTGLTYDIDSDIDMLIDNSGGFGSLGVIPSAFDLRAATGAQLDVIGQWVGFSRYLNLAGFGYVTLSDADYHPLLLAKMAANHWDGSMDTLQIIVNGLFPLATFKLVVVDNQDMTMSILRMGDAPTALQNALLLSDLIIPRPEGVLINNYTTVVGARFGLDYETTYIAGPDVGSL